MSWPEETIKSWDDFVNLVDNVISIEKPLSDTYTFRGSSLWLTYCHFMSQVRCCLDAINEMVQLDGRIKVGLAIVA